MKSSSKKAVLILLILAIAVVAIIFILKPTTDETKNELNTIASSTNNTVVTPKNETVVSQTSSLKTNTTSSTPNTKITSKGTTPVSLYIGTSSNYTTIDTTIDKSVSVEEQAQYLIEKIGEELGCKILVNEISSGKGGMTIDLKSNSAPLSENNPTKVYSVFDSINLTFQKYFGISLDVYFSVENNNISINTISPTFTINSTVPYTGSGK